MRAKIRVLCIMRSCIVFVCALLTRVSQSSWIVERICANKMWNISGRHKTLSENFCTQKNDTIKYRSIHKHLLVALNNVWTYFSINCISVWRERVSHSWALRIMHYERLSYHNTIESTHAPLRWTSPHKLHTCSNPSNKRILNKRIWLFEPRPRERSWSVWVWDDVVVLVIFFATDIHWCVVMQTKHVFIPNSVE